MTLFSYVARRSDNSTVSGTIDALSVQDARETLMKEGLLAEEIHEATLQEKEQMNTKPKKEDSPSEPIVEKAQKKDIPVHKTEAPYYPLLDTLQLYAGWLLAWYGIVYAFGYYQSARSLPFHIPYVEALVVSPLVLSFTVAAFLFLMLSSIYKAFKGRLPLAISLIVLGAVIFVLYRMNLN